MMFDRFMKTLYYVGENPDIPMRTAIATHLFSLYEIPYRDYHNINHIEHCLKELDSYSKDFLDFIIELSIFYYDAVYAPKEKDNEKRSCDWAEFDLTMMKIPADDILKLKRLIMATKHDVYPNDREDEKIIVDIDLSILGQDEKIFNKYCIGIREEYSHVEDYGYAKSRKKFLQKLLERPRIYQTNFFHEKYEVIARENIKREMFNMSRIQYRDQP